MRGELNLAWRALELQHADNMRLQARLDALLTILANMDRERVADYMSWRSDQEPWSFEQWDLNYNYPAAPV